MLRNGKLIECRKNQAIQKYSMKAGLREPQPPREIQNESGLETSPAVILILKQVQDDFKDLAGDGSKVLIEVSCSFYRDLETSSG